MALIILNEMSNSQRGHLARDHSRYSGIFFFSLGLSTLCQIMSRKLDWMLSYPLVSIKNWRPYTLSALLMYLKDKKCYKALEAFLSGGRVIDVYIVPAAKHDYLPFLTAGLSDSREGQEPANITTQKIHASRQRWNEMEMGRSEPLEDTQLLISHPMSFLH